MTEDEEEEFLLSCAIDNMEPGEVPSHCAPGTGTKSWWLRGENWATIDPVIKRAFRYRYVDQQELLGAMKAEFVDTSTMSIEERENTERLRQLIKGMRGIVSSSNVGAAVGDSEYETVDDLFLAKTNQTPPMPNCAATDHGHKYEDVAAQLFCDDRDEYVFKFSSIPWEGHPNISASVDRCTRDGYNVEIKAPLYKRVCIDEDLQFVLETQIHYWHQMQLQMLILDLKGTHFIRYGRAPNKHHGGDETLYPCSADPTRKQKLLQDEVLSIVFVPRDYGWWDRYKDRIHAFIARVEQYRAEHPDWNQRKWTDDEAILFFNAKNPHQFPLPPHLQKKNPPVKVNAPEKKPKAAPKYLRRPVPSLPPPSPSTVQKTITRPKPGALPRYLRKKENGKGEE